MLRRLLRGFRAERTSWAEPGAAITNVTAITFDRFVDGGGGNVTFGRNRRDIASIQDVVEYKIVPRREEGKTIKSITVDFDGHSRICSTKVEFRSPVRLWVASSGGPPHGYKVTVSIIGSMATEGM